MRASRNWEDFKQKVDDVLPRCEETLKLPFMAEPISILVIDSSSVSEEREGLQLPTQ